MKILMLNYEFPPLIGGGSIQSMYLAREYAKKHKVYFLTTGYNEFGVGKYDGYILHRIKTSRKKIDVCSSFEMLSFVYQAWKKIHWVVKNFKPDIIHVFFTIPTGLLMFHPKLRKIPFIVSVRGSDVPGHSPDRFKILYELFKPIVKNIWKKSKAVVCNSEELKKEVLSLNPELKIDVIHNGIDINKFKSARSRKNKNRLVLLYVGRLISLKQIDLIIKILPDIIKNISKKIIFRIVGLGPQEKELKDLVKKLNLEDNVIFVGEVDYENIEKEYQKADVYVQLSRAEGMSNTIMEAMACGLPVITTDVGGVRDFVRGNGIVLGKGDINRLNYYLTKINYDQMSIQSRKIALGFSFDKIAQDYMAIIKKN